MKVLLDSSVLVAATVAVHPMHARAHPWLDRAQRGELRLVVAAHSLAETFAVLTRLPLQPRIAPSIAWQLLHENVLSVAEIVALTAAEYRAIVRRLADLGIAGGTVYDGLIAKSAQKARADRLVTLNPSHFHRVWPDGRDVIAEP